MDNLNQNNKKPAVFARRVGSLEKMLNSTSNFVNKNWKKLAVAGAIAYVAVCLPNSFKVSGELKTLADQFSKTALTQPYSVEDKGEVRVLDYSGKIDKILKDRDDYLKANSSISIGKWYVGAPNGGNSEKIIDAPPVAFCYNPFAKITSYGKNEKKK